VVFGAQSQLLADAFVLRDRGLLHRRVRRLEDATRIGECRIQEQLEEFVAEVVVGRDVAPAARPRIAVKRVKELERGSHQPREPSLPLLYERLVRRENPNDRGQIVGLPVAVQVGLRAAERPAEREQAIEARIADAHRRLELCARFAVRLVPAGFDEVQRPVADRCEPAADELLRQAIEACSIVACGASKTPLE